MFVDQPSYSNMFAYNCLKQFSFLAASTTLRHRPAAVQDDTAEYGDLASEQLGQALHRFRTEDERPSSSYNPTVSRYSS